MHGLNPSGGCLIAKRVVASLPRPMPASSPVDLQRFAAATGASPSFPPAPLNSHALV